MCVLVCSSLWWYYCLAGVPAVTVVCCGGVHARLHARLHLIACASRSKLVSGLQLQCTFSTSSAASHRYAVFGLQAVC